MNPKTKEKTRIEFHLKNASTEFEKGHLFHGIYSLDEAFKYLKSRNIRLRENYKFSSQIFEILGKSYPLLTKYNDKVSNRAFNDLRKLEIKLENSFPKINIQ